MPRKGAARSSDRGKASAVATQDCVSTLADRGDRAKAQSEGSRGLEGGSAAPGLRPLRQPSSSRRQHGRWRAVCSAGPEKNKALDAVVLSSVDDPRFRTKYRCNAYYLPPRATISTRRNAPPRLQPHGWSIIVRVRQHHADARTNRAGGRVVLSDFGRRPCTVALGSNNAARR